LYTATRREVNAYGRAGPSSKSVVCRLGRVLQQAAVAPIESRGLHEPLAHVRLERREPADEERTLIARGEKTSQVMTSQRSSSSERMILRESTGDGSGSVAGGERAADRPPKRALRARCARASW
jgi:hypothetical protein